MAGVKVDSITPLQIPKENLHRVLINLHGGGFNSDSGSRIEGDPIANLAKIRVVGGVLPAGAGASVSGGGR